jgi:WD40 repeat protein
MSTTRLVTFSDPMEHVQRVQWSPTGSSFGFTTSDASRGLEIRTGDSSLMKFLPGGHISDFHFSCESTVLVASERRPLQLIDTTSGLSISTFSAYSFTEEIVHPVSVRFSASGASIAGGFPSSVVRIWDTAVPGRQIRDIVFSTRKAKVSRGSSFKGIVCAVNWWDENMIVGGTYGGQIRLFDQRGKDGLDFSGELNGVVQLETLAEKQLIVSGHRMSRFVNVWDVRSPSEPVVSIPRSIRTNQRTQFGVDGGREIVTGDEHGIVTSHDISTGEILFQTEVAPKDVIPCVDVNGNGEVLFGTGCRRYATAGGWSSSGEDEDMIDEIIPSFIGKLVLDS